MTKILEKNQADLVRMRIFISACVGERVRKRTFISVCAGVCVCERVRKSEKGSEQLPPFHQHQQRWKFNEVAPPSSLPKKLLT